MSATTQFQRPGRKTAITLVIVCVLPMSSGLVGAQMKQDIQKFARIDSPRGWITFNDSTTLRGSTIFETHSEEFGLGPSDEMRLIRSSRDRTGIVHYRYQQYHDGLAIDGAVFIIHENNGRASTANGRIVSDLHINTTPHLNMEDALDKALRSVPADRYAWEDMGMEQRIKELRKDEHATYYPNPTLVLAMRDPLNDVHGKNLVLAYRVEVMCADPLQGYSVYIDAIDGKLLNKQSLFAGCTNATAVTMYNGVQTIVTDSVAATEFQLRDSCRGGGIVTLKYISPSTTDVLNSTTTWPAADSMYTQAHWAAMMTYDYFYNEHGRNSYDDSGGVMEQIVGFGTASQFVDWRVTLAQPSAFSPNWQNSLDIIGHEWTHALVAATAHLGGADYSESKYLNESFADVFGSMVECYAESKFDSTKVCDDFLIGEDVDPTMSSLFNRNMCQPEAQGGSGTYGGTNWTGSPGPDTYPRSGVQNKWFCLLANGGADTNTHPCRPYEFNVEGIGRAKAARIAYQNLTNYLTPTATYGDARRGSIAAALADSTLDSSDVAQVIEAWNAVGVYDDHSLLVCGTFDSLSTPDVFQALYELRADTLCKNPDSTVVRNGGHVEFVAGNVIRIGSRFRARRGSYFRAYIEEPCEGWNVAKANTVGDHRDVTTRPVVNPPELRAIPNPFDQQVELRFTLYNPSMVAIELYNTYGMLVRTVLESDYHNRGTYSTALTKQALASGAYLCVLRTAEHQVVTVLFAR